MNDQCVVILQQKQCGISYLFPGFRITWRNRVFNMIRTNWYMSKTGASIWSIRNQKLEYFGFLPYFELFSVTQSRLIFVLLLTYCTEIHLHQNAKLNVRNIINSNGRQVRPLKCTELTIHMQSMHDVLSLVVSRNLYIR